jgi:hypothetical protein
MNVEVPKLLAAAVAEGVQVLWVSLSPSFVSRTPIYAYQAVLPPRPSLEEMTEPQQRQALVRIAECIHRALLDPLPPVSEPVLALPPPAESTLLWRIRCRLWREPLAEGVALPMAWIPAAPGGDPGEYLLGSELVSFRQWQVVAGWPPLGEELKPDPTAHGEPDQPVFGISHGQALEFCRRLAARTGRYYELPSEEQWEHACRAGGTTPYSWGVPWSASLAADAANPWGLRQMHGGLWEWCRGGGLRGGSWADPVERRQASSRAEPSELWHPSTVGLRVCCLPFGTPIQTLEASRSQWRPPLSQAACELVLDQPLTENQFEELTGGLRRFQIRAATRLRMFLSLLADRMGGGFADSGHPLRLRNPVVDPDIEAAFLMRDRGFEELVGEAAFMWKDCGLWEPADQAASPEAFWAALGLPQGERWVAFHAAWNRAVSAFPDGG